MEHGGGSASGTVDLAFDADGDGVLSDVSEVVTVDVQASASEVQEALRALGGLLDGVEVSLDSGIRRARNGGETRGEGLNKFPNAILAATKWVEEAPHSRI